MDMDITMATTILSVLAAARMLLTASGAFVSVTVGMRKDMAGASRTGRTRGVGLTILILLLSVWIAPPVRGWT